MLATLPSLWAFQSAVMLADSSIGDLRVVWYVVVSVYFVFALKKVKDAPRYPGSNHKQARLSCLCLRVQGVGTGRVGMSA